MTQDTKTRLIAKYPSYEAAGDEMALEKVVELFASDMDYVSDNHPEIMRLLDFLHKSLRDIKEILGE
jgi:hypothetical protein